jgi:hypothetical protein
MSTKTILLDGDFTMDWTLVYSQGAQPADATTLWNASSLARVSAQPGGVALLEKLLRTVLPQTVTLHAPPLPAEAIHPGDRRFHHSYSIWTRMNDRAWRVSQFLGIDAAQPQVTMPPLAAQQADLIVLDDSNHGYRLAPTAWPTALDGAAPDAWVLLKTVYPVLQGALWEKLLQTRREHLIVLVTANDLRLSNAQISRALSWERAAQDTLWELSYNPQLKVLSQAAHVIVSFQNDGAVLISRQANALECRLVFDPQTVEDGWGAAYSGEVIGYNTCLTAAIARALLAETRPSITGRILAGIHSGLSAMRVLLSHGFENVASGGGVQLQFPHQAIAADLAQPTHRFAETLIQSPLTVLSGGPAHGGLFTILSEQCRGDLLPLARRIVLEGPEKALSNIPLGRFGKLLTVDRNEIESYRTIATLIQEYLQQERQEKPLSIAVFGAPGSGKSFGIKEIANSLSSRIRELTFNLSQMNSPADLIGALHQVRDEALRGKMPLVFWDEFDSNLDGTDLGWLRYFLSPMQDGSFLEGQVTHPIGRAIFVFAGGTSETMEEFGRGLEVEAFRAAKGPDFLSRLKGFINILGPNPRRGHADPFYLIRRAILLHSLLRRQAGQLFNPTLQIDANVLDALLETKTYLHGVRSMEALLAMSQLSGKVRFERSCLPPPAQLNLHVIGWEFMARVQKPVFEGEALEKLARAVHEDFCAYLERQGYLPGSITDEQASPPTHSALRPFDELSAADQQANRDHARALLTRLDSAGYVMIHARSNEPPLVFPDRNLEELAEAEHIRWVKDKLASDARWHYAPQTCKERFEHAGLLPWRVMSEEELTQVFRAEEIAALGRAELPEAEKEKDRELIRRIPFILARVGYTVIRPEERT